MDVDSGHSYAAHECPLSDIKRTSRGHAVGFAQDVGG